MISRAECEELFAAARADCDPSRLVGYALRARPVDARVGLALGVSAMAMARGAGPIARGVVATTFDDGRGVPAGWAIVDPRMIADEPVLDMIASAQRADRILALISAGVEARCSRRILGGALARISEAPITTLAISHVISDDLRAIGGGPTIADDRPDDHAQVIANLMTLANAVDAAIETGEFGGPHVPTTFEAPLCRDVAEEAEQLARSYSWTAGVAWGHPAFAGPGGRAQQLALELAQRIRGEDLAAFVVASTGLDGAPPRGRAHPAGAYVDGTTWDAMLARRIDPGRALDDGDAGPALDAIGALVVTGPTGFDFGDLVIAR